MQIFLELAATAASLGNTWQGGYPTQAVFLEQFYKPTAAQQATKAITELQGKPKTLALGSDTMVSNLQALCPHLTSPCTPEASVLGHSAGSLPCLMACALKCLAQSFGGATAIQYPLYDRSHTGSSFPNFPFRICSTVLPDKFHMWSTAHLHPIFVVFSTLKSLRTDSTHKYCFSDVFPGDSVTIRCTSTPHHSVVPLPCHHWEQLLQLGYRLQ